MLFFQVDEQSSCFSLDVGVVVGRRSIQVAHQSKLQVNPGASQSRTSPGRKSIRLQVSHGCKSIVLVRRSNVESGSLLIRVGADVHRGGRGSSRCGLLLLLNQLHQQLGHVVLLLLHLGE